MSDDGWVGNIKINCGTIQLLLYFSRLYPVPPTADWSNYNLSKSYNLIGCKKIQLFPLPCLALQQVIVFSLLTSFQEVLSLEVAVFVVMNQFVCQLFSRFQNIPVPF